MPVDVVAAVIERDGRLLVCQRPALQSVDYQQFNTNLAAIVQGRET